jgi:pimeloyl-ACP methyl ester carboxylesterase
MPKADNSGVMIEYDTFGDPVDPALLLIMGFTAQMTAWDEGFCRMLAGKGLHVIRFDNRDCGLSDKTEGPPPDLMALLSAVQSGQGVTIDVPYSMSDMVADGLAVLDDLGILAAHVAGASMGGMIAQQMAIEHPHRVLSLTSIMSTTGNPKVGQGEPGALAALMTPPPQDRDGAIERGVSLGRVISGPLFDEEKARRRATEAYDRSFHPAGAPFQMAAIAKTGDRTDGLRNLRTPALVVHGAVDPLIGLSGGEATAEAVPDARLLVIEEMGHDLPEPHWPEIASAIADLAGLGWAGGRARPRSSTLDTVQRQGGST